MIGINLFILMLILLIITQISIYAHIYIGDTYYHHKWCRYVRVIDKNFINVTIENTAGYSYKLSLWFFIMNYNKLA